ncbi:MAG: hypothetical protein BJG00_007495 [Limnothrix sp. CACIAM 69d]|nr:MAG: hypothetical protein BJG00_007495 [Limnothrix sp. CACIAM 69d]
MVNLSLKIKTLEIKTLASAGVGVRFAVARFAVRVASYCGLVSVGWGRSLRLIFEQTVTGFGAPRPELGAIGRNLGGTINPAEPTLIQLPQRIPQQTDGRNDFLQRPS